MKLRQDPLDMNVEEEILEGQEEYDSDSDLSLSGDEFEDEEDAGDLVPPTLTTRNGNGTLEQLSLLKQEMVHSLTLKPIRPITP